MLIARPAGERGVARTSWLDSRHTFSFGHYHDPAWMGFGPLRVINEDRVAAAGGFAPHHHANMEILSYVLSGQLAHRDSATGGAGGVITPGQLQWMSAGHGIEHSEFNASSTQPVHFVQVWLQPDRVNAAPAYGERSWDPAARRGRWTLLASPDGRDDSLAIPQQAWLRGALLGGGEPVSLQLDAGHRYWIQVAYGTVDVVIGGGDSLVLLAGDGLGVLDEGGALVLGGRGDGIADVLVFDLPV